MHDELFNHLDHFSEIEKLQVIALLDDAERKSQAYDGNWSAPWLHSHIHSNRWILNKKHSTRVVNDELTDAQEIDWGVQLADGSYLTDLQNKAFLSLLQKIAFLAREAPFNRTSLNNTSHISFIHFLLVIARWLYLHKDIYDPEDKMLRLIDGTSLNDFFHMFSEGGVTFLLRFPQRILIVLYKNVFHRSPPAETLDDPFSIPLKDLNSIRSWLNQNDYVTTSGRNRTPYLKRDMIANLLGESFTSFSSNRFNAFLQLLTPDCDTPLLVTDIKTECYSHSVPLWIDAKDSRATIGSLHIILAQWRILISLHRHLPDELPKPECFKNKALTYLINRLGEKSGHTPWIPLKTALAYTSESLRWIHVYGDDLVSLFLDVYRHFHTQNLLDIEALSTDEKARVRAQRDEYILRRIPDSLQPLNISGYSRALSRRSRGLTEHGDYSMLRSAPSLFDAMNVLLGAVIVLLGTTKPIRQDEICNLDRDCITIVNNDGYWITHEQGKKNVDSAWMEDARPIPAITAKAILLVRRLSDEVKAISGTNDSWVLNKLFVLPLFGRSPKVIKLMDKRTSNRFLDVFCDYIGLPTDQYGRRWYVRIHETRKSFLITFFWCFRYASLDAARWIAGHSDAKHIYAYIQANFPGDELPAIEAEYATRVMWDFESQNTKEDADNVEQLHHTVCKHFNVSTLSLVGEEDLRNWLAIQFEKGNIQIQPYSIECDDGSVRTQIAFKLSKIEATND